MNDNTNLPFTEIQAFGNPVKQPSRVRNKCTWAEEDQPHYKLLQQGRCSLTDCELLSMIIGTNPEVAMAISTQLLAKYDHDLSQIFKASAKDLEDAQVKGITPRVARLIIAVGELGRRRILAPTKKRTRINTSKDAYDILYPRIGDNATEVFAILTLNRANCVLNYHEVSHGGLTGTIADPRVILRHCLQDKATGVILSHNHPSGNIKPSSQDIDLTKKVKQGSAFMDISVFDHLIIGDNTYYSFADEGMM